MVDAPVQPNTEPIEKHHSPNSIADYIPNPPDGGYGWIIMLASFMTNFMVDGIAFTFGIFIADFQEHFGIDTAHAALIGSLNSGFYLLSAAMAGALVNKFGCRAVSMAGAVVATIGFAFCTLSPTAGIMMLTYGFIGGVGLGHLYLPSIIAVSYYFQKRRALATGVAVCGTGVGCFVIAPLGKFLLQKYEWKGAMLIIAGITLNGCVVSALLRPLEAPAAKKRHATSSSSRPVSGLTVSADEHTTSRVAVTDTAMHAMGPAVTSNKHSMGSKLKYGAKVFRNKILPISIGSKKSITWKLPRDADKDDLARPLYRSDIFYSGSVQNIPEFKTQPSLKDYMVSVTSAPHVAESDRWWKLGRFVPRQALVIFLEMTNITLFKEPSFVIICVANMLCSFGLFIPFVFIATRAMSLGVSEFKATFLISIVGIFNTCGRVLVGIISDFSCVNTLLLHNSSLVLGGVMCLVNTVCDDYISMCIYAAIYGLCIAMWMALTPIVVCKLVGLHRLTNAFGLLMTGHGISTLCATPIAGAIFDRTHDDDAPFEFCGAMMLCGGLLSFVLLLLPRSHERQVVEQTPTRSALDRIESTETQDSATDETVLEEHNI